MKYDQCFLCLSFSFGTIIIPQTIIEILLKRDKQNSLFVIITKGHKWIYFHTLSTGVDYPLFLHNNKLAGKQFHLDFVDLPVSFFLCLIKMEFLFHIPDCKIRKEHFIYFFHSFS